MGPGRDHQVRGSETVLSRDKQARASAPAAAQPAAGRPVEPGLALTGASTAPAPAKPVRQTSRRTLKNWRVRSRLLLLIIIPTLTAVVLGAISIVTSVQSALSDQQVEQLANLSQSVTQLAGFLGKEEVWTAYYIGLGPSNGGRGSGPKQDVSALENITSMVGQGQPWETGLRNQIAALGSGYPAQVEADARNITALLGELGVLRSQAQTTNLPALAVVDGYTNIIDQLLAIDDNIALSSGDQQLATDVRALGLVSRIRAEVAEQGALLTYAYQVQTFPPNVLAAVQAAQAEQTANLDQFNVSASPQQVAAYRNTAVGSLVDFSQQYEQTAIQLGSNNQPLGPAPYDSNEVAAAFITGPDLDLATLQQNLVTQTIDRSSALRRDAIITASAVGGGVLIVLLLALLLTTVIGRSMVRPLRRLRSGALEIAGVRLPETVRQMSDSDGAAISLDPEPIDVDSTDEIGEVARAFDQVHREAIRLAANEAALRGNVNAMFVNLSRRSQSLVERQIRLIDDLEQGEQDSDRLSSLFQMDHLATRMRRNSENLLVLAGHEATRRWNQPVALVDVLRAAVSEIEQYERVTLNVQPGIAVRGHAVNDVVHLLAELAENATSFSSADTPVVVAGHLLSSGGVLLDITDQGVGMGAEEMAHANWRLDNPPVVDVAVSRRMGLFVVARLAARHGIRVRLRPAPTGGLTALVWLPDEVISHAVAPGAPGTRFDPAVPAMVAVAAGTVEDVASATEQEINAARAPKFASLQAEEGNGKLTARRVPGAGPRPGAGPSWGTAATGPMPAFRSSPQPAGSDGGDESPDGAEAGYAQPEPFGTSPLPAVDADAPAPLDGSPEPELANGAAAAAAAAAGAAISRPEHGTFSLDGGSKNGDVVIPPAEHVSTQNRLPIFEAVESDWFRRGRSGLGGWPGPQGSPETEVAEPTPMPEVAWATPSDQGWQAAAAVSAPATGGTTGAGLPKRVPQANLVPGAAGATAAEEPAQPSPARSAAATRDRFASFQRGSREGRAAAAADDNWSDGEDGSR
jgi:signal transduction histidine kinase